MKYWWQVVFKTTSLTRLKPVCCKLSGLKGQLCFFPTHCRLICGPIVYDGLHHQQLTTEFQQHWGWSKTCSIRQVLLDSVQGWITIESSKGHFSVSDWLYPGLLNQLRYHTWSGTALELGRTFIHPSSSPGESPKLMLRHWIPPYQLHCASFHSQIPERLTEAEKAFWLLEI